LAEIFIVSDTHFSHAATFSKFKVHTPYCPANVAVPVDEPLPCDCPFMRPFSSVEEMDETMIANWNKVVRPQDKVYHLGDVAMKAANIMKLQQCNGHKRLVRGNHDIFDDKYYRSHFEAIYGTRLLDGLLLSHIPVHPDSLRYDWVNVHGHVHNNIDKHHFGPKYHNVSVEVTDYRPLTLGEVKERIKAQQEENRAIADRHLLSMGVKRLFTDAELMSEWQKPKSRS
jgi:calcineurin-like phosphoesterase family protein